MPIHPYAIYGLTDPRKIDDIKRVRYVGKGRPLIRYRRHIRCAHREGRIYCTSGARHTRCCNWLRNVLVAGLLPGQRILEWTIPRDGGERERAWIRSLRDQGADLTNLTDGGEGTWGRKLSLESIAKISAANMGNKNCLGKKNGLGSKSRLGQHTSEEEKQKISVARTGKGLGNKNALGHHPSAENLAQMSARMMGNKLSLGNKNALGCKWSPESRAKIKGNKNGLGNKSHLGQYASEETKLKMSAAHRAYRARKKATLIEPPI